MAVGTLVISASYVSIIVTEHLFPNAPKWANLISLALTFTGMGITMYGLFHFLRAKKLHPHVNEADNFFMVCLRASTMHSFSFTFLGLVFVRALHEFGYLTISRDLLLDLAMASVMFFYAASFFVQAWREGGFSDDEGEA